MAVAVAGEWVGDERDKKRVKRKESPRRKVENQDLASIRDENFWIRLRVSFDSRQHPNVCVAFAAFFPNWTAGEIE